MPSAPPASASATAPRQSGGESAPGAFDDAGDLERHDVIESAASDPGPFLSQPVWLDAGDRDPFRPGIEAVAGTLEQAGVPLSFHIWPGGHDGSYWTGHWDEYLRFYAKAIARC